MRKGGENVTPEVRIQTPIVEEIALLTGIACRPKATYLWAKFTSKNGGFIELVTSSDENAYTEGVGEDGYYYQRIVYIVGADNVGTYLLEL